MRNGMRGALGLMLGGLIAVLIGCGGANNTASNTGNGASGNAGAGNAATCGGGGETAVAATYVLGIEGMT